VSPGDVEFVQVVVVMALVPGTVAGVLRMDERRLRGERLRRAWSPVSRDAHIFGSWLFGVLYACPALVIYFTKTRWSLAGFGLGLLAAATLLELAGLSMSAVPTVIDWLGL
jgi:hypothetical protein